MSARVKHKATKTVCRSSPARAISDEIEFATGRVTRSMSVDRCRMHTPDRYRPGAKGVSKERMSCEPKILRERGRVGRPRTSPPGTIVPVQELEDSSERGNNDDGNATNDRQAYQEPGCTESSSNSTSSNNGSDSDVESHSDSYSDPHSDSGHDSHIPRNPPARIPQTALINSAIFDLSNLCSTFTSPYISFHPNSGATTYSPSFRKAALNIVNKYHTNTQRLTLSTIANKVIGMETSKLTHWVTRATTTAKQTAQRSARVEKDEKIAAICEDWKTLLDQAGNPPRLSGKRFSYDARYLGVVRTLEGRWCDARGSKVKKGEGVSKWFLMRWVHKIPKKVVDER